MAGIGTTIALIKSLSPEIDPAVVEEAVSDWLNDHPEATTTVQDGSITKAKLNSDLLNIIVTKKLDGWDTVNWQTGYINGNGGVSSNSSFRNTDFLPVTEGDIISYQLMGYSTLVYIVTGYDSSKARVASASVVGSSSWQEGTYTVPSGVAYVRISSGSVTTEKLYFNSDDVLGDKVISTKGYIDDADDALSDRIDTAETSIQALDGMESVKSYYVPSPNLLDPTKTTPAPSIGTGYVWTDYIPVIASERYTFRADASVYQWYWYDSTKTEVSHKTTSARGAELTAPVGAEYARLVYKSADITQIMFAHGVVGDYVPYGTLIPKEELPDYIERDTNNLNNPHKYVFATYIKTSDGTVGPYSNSSCTDFIPVEEGETYYFGGENEGTWNRTGAAAYDENYAFVEAISADTYTALEGVAFIRISYSTPGDGYVAPCVRKGQTGVAGPSKFNAYDTFRLVNAKPTEYEQSNGLYGLMWNAMGDSITEGSGTTKSYSTFIAERAGINIRNYGVSNTAIARRNSSYTNDMSVRYVNMDDDADIVTVFGGTNDHGNNIPIGEWGDSTVDTLYGAMKILCEGLINKYMGKKIGFITPLPKYNTSNNTDYSYPSASFKPYIDCIKDVCARYSIPVLDLYTESGIAPSLASVRTAMIPDGLHPNAVGHEVISWKIQRFLERL